MKKIWSALLLLLLAASLFAQTNPPARLALVALSDQAAPAVDLLTAQLTGNPQIQLLERDQIDKVYHEQQTAAANRNDIQLGRILGTDGLLLINVAASPQMPGFTLPSSASPPGNLTMRLIAVKPGVILTEGTISWPPKDMAQWAQSTAAHLNSFLPKLTVLAKDAIPLSVVNLSSSIQSADAQETERELKLLTIQRLSQEPQFFVLERQKMQLLSEEKSLKSDVTPFWDGSYFLDGTIDQNGYSKDTITINARLRPPHGGAPLLFEVSGSRTNLADVVNSLAIKVAALLKVNPNIKQWDAASEASQYFDEANWALRWGVAEEAQAASESAWALGKHDLDCASVRVKAYVSEIPVVEGAGEGHFRSMADYTLGKEDPHYTHINDAPNPENIDRALYALEAYYEFSRTSPDGEPKILTRGAGWDDWHDSDWYELGIETLTAVSQVLQHYCFNPQSQPPVADKLEDLRSLTRSVAAFISQSPQIHDSYYVGDRIVTSDELSHTIEENPNIFRCEVNWGCFWQERPEDSLSLYRDLMSSPVFCYIHTDFWNRKPIQPRLAAWNEEDRQRVPMIWAGFERELEGSTNIFLNMEARAIAVIDASNDTETATALTNFFDGILENRDAFVGNNVEVMYLNWGADALVQTMMASGYLTDTKESLQRLFYSKYRPQFDAMDNEYWQKTIPALKTVTVFEKQKQYLANFTPYDFSTFMEIFSSKNYSRAQAAEILPLVVAYESNLVATASGQKLFFAQSDARWIGMILEKPLRQILNPPAPPINIATARNVHASPPAAPPPPAMANISPPTQVPSNILSIVHFSKIPPGEIQSNDISGSQIFAQRWSEEKLLFGVAYNTEIYTFDARGNWQSTENASMHAIAIFNPANETWEMVKCPRTVNSSALTYSFQNYNNLIILFRGDLFSSIDGALQKFDFQTGKWQNVEIPEAGQCDLFSVAGHLYGANSDTIFELMDDGSARILAATRRRPAVTILDSLEALQSPQLFAGPDQSLCASVGKNIYRWDGNDWHVILTMDISQPPEIFDDAILFRNIPFDSDAPPELWAWDKKEPLPELCLLDRPMPHRGIFYSPAHTKKTPNRNPLWKPLPQDYLTSASATFSKSNLYFFVDHADVAMTNGTWTVTEKDGYHAKLVCLSRDLKEPAVVPLKFDITHGLPPLKTLGQKSQPWLMFNSSALNTTMHFSGNTLFLSQRNTPGVWTVSMIKLESAIEAQKQVLLAQIAQDMAAKENR